MRVILNMLTHSVNDLVADIKGLPVTSSGFHYDLLEKKWLLTSLYLKLHFQCTRMSQPSLVDNVIPQSGFS